MAGIIVDGRMADPSRPDEVVVDQNLAARVRARHRQDDDDRRSTGRPRRSRSCRPGLLPRGVDPNFEQRLRVVGISKSIDSEQNWTPVRRLLREIRRTARRLHKPVPHAAERHEGPPAAPQPTCSASSDTPSTSRTSRSSTGFRRSGTSCVSRRKDCSCSPLAVLDRRRRADRAGAGPGRQLRLGRHADVEGDRRRPQHRDAGRS